jgi:phage replication initiation protein
MIKVRKGRSHCQRAASASADTALIESVPHSQAVGTVAAPIDNMGVTNQSNEQLVQLVMSDGELKTIVVRAPSKGQIAVIDQVSFTFSLETLESVGFDLLSSQDQQVSQISELIESILGYGITNERNAGTDFYKRSFDLGQFGQVGIGGQNDTVLVHLHGLGALKAKYGWEHRLYGFLSNQAIRPKITRIDLAYDDFLGESISVDWALESWRSGGFTWTGQAPNVEQIGNWLCPSGKGRTFAVGARASGKYCRVYEKGKKEGCSESPWTRFEVELKSKDRVIPFDCLLDPSSYLAGTYPCVDQLYFEANRIKTEKKTAEYNYDKMIEICKVQMGRQLRFLSNHLNDSDKVLSLVMHPDPLAVPKRLKAITAGINTMPAFLHNLPRQLIDIEQVDFSIKVN